MKRMLLAAIAAVGLMGVVAANGNGPIVGKVAGGGCSGCGTTASSAAPLKPLFGTEGCAECERNKKFGLHPLLQRLAFWKSTECGTCGLKSKFGLGCGKDGCGKGGCFGGNCAGQGAGFNPYPNGVPGTLVFPNQPYVRSPRDWYEK
jgi:hypothetical protein